MKKGNIYIKLDERLLKLRKDNTKNSWNVPRYSAAWIHKFLSAGIVKDNLQSVVYCNDCNFFCTNNCPMLSTPNEDGYCYKGETKNKTYIRKD